MATLSDQEKEQLLQLLGDPSLVAAVAGGSSEAPTPAAGGDKSRSGLQRAFKAMLEQSRGQGGALAESLATRISGNPAFQQRASGLADLPTNQSGREELLSRVFGSGSRFGYSPTANKLDAFILGQAGGNALQNLASRRQGVLRSLGLPGEGSGQLPDTTMPPGRSGAAPGLGGGGPPGQGIAPGQGGSGSPPWAQGPGVGMGLPSGGNPRLPLPRPTPNFNPGNIADPRMQPLIPPMPGSMPRMPAPSPQQPYYTTTNFNAPSAAPRPAPPPQPRTTTMPAGSNPFSWLGGAINPTSAPTQPTRSAAPAPLRIGVPTRTPVYSTVGAAPAGSTTSQPSALAAALMKIRSRMI